MPSEETEPVAPLEDLADEDLVRRVREGDDAAFRVLTDRYAAKAHGVIHARLSPGLRRKVAASDILQESYLAAFRRFGDFDDRGEGSFGRWFAEIVQCKILDAARRHVGASKRSVAREVTRAGRSPTVNFAGAHPSPSQVVVGKELEESARTALAELPESYREVIELLRDEGLSLDETAERMGRSRDAVKMLYSRALGRLEELMGLKPAGRGERRKPTR